MNRFFKNNFNKRRVAVLSATFLLASLINVSCKKVESTIGQGVQSDSDQLGLKKTDTFSIITYSKLTDSVRSDERGVVMLGSYYDPVFGQVNSSFATQLNLQANNPNFGTLGVDGLTVDSIVLSLDLASGYGEMDPQTIKVHRLNTTIDPDDSLYTFSDADYDPTDLVMAGHGLVTPSLTDSVFVGDAFVRPQIRVRLDNALGEEFINETANSNLLDDASFISYFPGIYVTTENTQSPGEGAVFVFNIGGVDTKITLYYHDDVTENGEFGFVFAKDIGHFNKIEYMNTSTEVYNQYENDTTTGQQLYYLQSGLVEPRVFFPTFTSLMGQNIAINKADLIMPVQYFEGSPYTPPSVLYVYADDNGENEIITTDVADFDAVNKNYSVDLTYHMQRVQTGEVTNKELLFSSNTFFSSLQRTIFNGANSSLKERPKLVVTYTEY